MFVCIHKANVDMFQSDHNDIVPYFESQEETSRIFFDEIEIRAYLTVVLSVSKQVKGASLSGL